MKAPTIYINDNLRYITRLSDPELGKFCMLTRLPMNIFIPKYIHIHTNIIIPK